MDSEILYQKLMDASLNYVSYRPRSRKEVIDFIAKTLKRWRTEGECIVEKVIVRLTELGYIDDSKFATWWVAQRSSHRPKGKKALQFELRSKGIDASSIDTAITDLSESDLAQKAIQKKIDLWVHLPIIEQKKKIYSFLSLRGFGHESVQKIIDGLKKKEYNEQ